MTDDLIARLRANPTLRSTIFEEALRAENARLRETTMGEYGDLDLADELMALRAENARLREALRPFADLADKIEAANDDDDYHFPAAKISDLRAARAALVGKVEQNDGK